MSELETLVSSYILPKEAPETYQIRLPDGELITCRRIVSYKDIADFKKELAAFWQRCKDGNLPPKAREYAPETYEEARAAFTLIYSSHEPTKFSEHEALMLLRAPWVLERLVQQIDERQANDVVDARLASFERTKKDSRGTDGNGPESSNPDEVSDATPAT